MRDFKTRFFYETLTHLAWNGVGGDILEFGCAGGASLRTILWVDQMVHRETNESRHRIVGFDSFQGLPELDHKEAHHRWQRGLFNADLNSVIRFLGRSGLGRHYWLEAGWYQETLTQQTRQRLNLKKAALIHVDCDLESSTDIVLEFVTPLIVPGTVIAFDDWFCYDADPDRGELKSFAKWLARNPQIKAIPYRNYGPDQVSFILRPRDGRTDPTETPGFVHSSSGSSGNMA